ncbi:insulinase family protein [Lactobacillus acidophilus]|uniref:M16 family metallopeptidase n=1 Tax=Lactobacillus acidophilus TaxID=1579 RepID=UPI0021A399B7|nr:insulinase family protein [Lactobacillus acidophilus]MCT3601649.1 insulinase family protein [Lactobacillus acidophilus]MCT3622983.1 insulinase family protein [Lactobacillus acidophilus]
MLTTNITIRKNKKFTTAGIGCFLRLPLTNHNLAFASLLSRLQMNTSLSYPTIAAQQRKLAQLYDLQLDIMPQLFGNQIILMYYANFVEPIEVLDPDYTYEEIIQTISQIIRFPAYDNNLFDYAKRQLEDEYREIMVQPSNYALDRFFKLWYEDQPEYAENFMGPIDEIKNTTIVEMRDFIENLRDMPMAVIGMGRDNQLMTKILRNIFKGAGIIKKFQVSDLVIPAKRKLIEKVDEQDNIQAQLLMGFGFKQRISYQEQVVGLLLEQYLAGDQSSKLFSQIREELGAAYDVQASDFANNSLFLINAGIDPQKVEPAKRIILNEMQKLMDGNIDEELFRKSKKAVYRNTRIGLDNQNWQLGQALRAELLPDYLDFDREAAIKKATPHQLINFVQNLFFNESYILK